MPRRTGQSPWPVRRCWHLATVWFQNEHRAPPGNRRAPSASGRNSHKGQTTARGRLGPPCSPRGSGTRPPRACDTPVRTQMHTQARGACAGARAEGEHLSARSCQLGSLPAGPRTLPAPSIYMRPGSARIGQAPGRSGAIAAAPAERVRPRLQPGSPVSSGDPPRGGGTTRASRGPPAPAPPPRAQSCPGTRPVLGRPRRPVSAGAGAPVPARPGGPPGTRGQCPAQHTVQSLHCRLKILTALRLPPAPTPDARGDS